MPKTTLTQALLRAYLGPDRVHQAPDPAPSHSPAPPIEIDYPRIDTQPEYRAAVDKLNHFSQQQAEAEAKLAGLHKQLAQACAKPYPTEADAIARADAMLAGEPHDVNLQAEIHAANKLIDALRQAIEAQHGVLRWVTEKFSRAAGRRYEGEHKKRVKRIMAAVDEMNAANRAELALRNDLHRLGYTGETLSAMNLRSVEDPNEVCGNVTYYWYRQAASYSQSAEEIATDVRKRRLAAALAP